MFVLQLTKSHFELLHEMYAMALKVIAMQRKKLNDFLIGYHAESSINHLVLNVISIDFNSSALRTQTHWNSFNTELFIPHHGKFVINSHLQWSNNWSSKTLELSFISELLQRIRMDGKISKLDPIMAQTLHDTPLKCHRCSAKPCNMHALKLHLRVHSNY